MIWMVVFYRFLGLIADIALLIYAALYFGVILAIPVTLTLPGIAGLILTIGVAADANVVVFERIKEEVRAGRERARRHLGRLQEGLLDDHRRERVTLITAAVLFVAASRVRGFAFLLGLGVIVSMFTAVAATRAMLGMLGGFRWFNNAAFMGATAKPVRWRIDFIGRNKLWFAISAAVILVGLGSLAIQGLNRGLDFTGGTRLVVRADGAATAPRSTTCGASPADRRRTRTTPSCAAPASRQLDHYTGFQIESKEISAQAVDEFRFALSQKYGRTPLPATSSRRPRCPARSAGRSCVGAILAFIFSIFLIVAYLAFRFDWRYALPTIAALVHDLLITLGVYSITGREVTSATVAAVLTILGYSLYDTIIVFDRVRENERLLRKHRYGQIVNISLWETLTRSLNTSVITLLPIVALFLFGGATLKDFAFALLIGIVSGAYSSFFIAAPLLVLLKGREPEFAKRKGTDDLPASSCARATGGGAGSRRAAGARARAGGRGRGARQPAPAPAGANGAGEARRGDRRRRSQARARAGAAAIASARRSAEA